MNYANEVKALEQGSTTWKPTVGMHKVTILSEPEEDKFVDKVTKEETPQIYMTIEVLGEQYDWYVTKGKTAASLYGQLMYLGDQQGKLIGQTIQVMVIETKNKDGSPRKSYSIVEAVEAIKAKDKK